MRHALVNRVVLALAGLLAAISLVFAWGRSGGAVTARAPAAEPGQPGAGEPPAAYERHCAGCHDARELADGLAAATDRTAAVLEMLELLADHGLATDDEDRAIVAWLHALAPPPAAPPATGGD